MRCNPFSNQASPVVRRYTRGIALTMGGYVLAVFGTSSYVQNHHPHGAPVYVLSAVPSFCIFAMLWVVIRYLRDETDEYQRMLVVRSLLGAAFAILAVGAFTDFTRAYGQQQGLPPFAEFVIFWVVFGMAQAIQSIGAAGDE